MSATAFSTASRPRSRSVDWRRFSLVGLGTIVAAVIANVVVYGVGSAVVGYDPEFVVLGSVAATILFTVVPAIVAVLLYAALLRFTAAPARDFTIIAAVVLVISVIPDFTYIPSVPGASAGQTAILVLMHVVAAGTIVTMLTRFSPTATRDRVS
jgi:hypothetical protein